jgi:hypothetical protein
MFEHKSEPIASRAQFIRRMVACFGLSIAVMAISLVIGVCGYHWIAHLPWIDSLLNASMILGGMGPVDHLDSSAAKVFASVYAIFSGLMLISVMGVILMPVIHRVIHKFHLADEDLNGAP